MYQRLSSLQSSPITIHWPLVSPHLYRRPWCDVNNPLVSIQEDFLALFFLPHASLICAICYLLKRCFCSAGLPKPRPNIFSSVWLNCVFMETVYMMVPHKNIIDLVNIISQIAFHALGSACPCSHNKPVETFVADCPSLSTFRIIPIFIRIFSWVSY